MYDILCSVVYATLCMFAVYVCYVSTNATYVMYACYDMRIVLCMLCVYVACVCRLCAPRFVNSVWHVCRYASDLFMLSVLCYACR